MAREATLKFNLHFVALTFLGILMPKLLQGLKLVLEAFAVPKF